MDFKGVGQVHPVHPVTHYLIVKVVQRDSYWLGLEQADDRTFGHCHVTRWSHVVLRRLQADLDAVMEMHGGPLFALHNPLNAHHAAFMAHLGFFPVGTANSASGAVVPLYERNASWALPQPPPTTP